MYHSVPLRTQSYLVLHVSLWPLGVIGVIVVNNWSYKIYCWLSAHTHTQGTELRGPAPLMNNSSPPVDRRRLVPPLLLRRQLVLTGGRTIMARGRIGIIITTMVEKYECPFVEVNAPGSVHEWGTGKNRWPPHTPRPRWSVQRRNRGLDFNATRTHLPPTGVTWRSVPSLLSSPRPTVKVGPSGTRVFVCVSVRVRVRETGRDGGCALEIDNVVRWLCVCARVCVVPVIMLVINVLHNNIYLFMN